MGHNTCGGCGRSVSSRSAWCPSCGKVLRRMSGAELLSVLLLCGAFAALILTSVWACLRGG